MIPYEQLSETERRVLDYVRERRTVSSAEVGERLSKTHSPQGRAMLGGRVLNRLVAKGWLSGSAGTWRLRG